MAKSSIQEVHSMSIKGTLDINEMLIETEDLGTKDLAELLSGFNGQNVTIRISQNTEFVMENLPEPEDTYDPEDD